MKGGGEHFLGNYTFYVIRTLPIPMAPPTRLPSADSPACPTFPTFFLERNRDRFSLDFDIFRE